MVKELTFQTASSDKNVISGSYGTQTSGGGLAEQGFISMSGS